MRSHPKEKGKNKEGQDANVEEVVRRTRDWMEQTRRLKALYQENPQAWEALEEGEKQAVRDMIRTKDEDETDASQKTAPSAASERMKREEAQVLFPVAFADFPEFERPPAFRRKNNSWEAFREESPWVARAMEDLREKEEAGELEPGEGFGDGDWKENVLEDLLDPYSDMPVEEQTAKQKEWVQNQAKGVEEEMERWIAGDNMDAETLRKDAETINADLLRAYNKSKQLHGTNYAPLGVIDASFWDKKVIQIREEEGQEDWERWSSGPALDPVQVFEIKSLHRMMYLLRKAFSSKDPAAAMELLRKYALYEENVKYSDEVATLEGFAEILGFYALQKRKGITYDLQQIWCVGPFFFSGESGDEILLDYSRVVVMYYMLLPGSTPVTNDKEEKISMKSTFIMNPRGKIFRVVVESDVMIHEGFTLQGPK